MSTVTYPAPEAIEQLLLNLPNLPNFTIGRAAVNQLVLPSIKVSSRHACLTPCTETIFLLEDTNSKHGTFVNDLRISRKLIEHTDRIRFADSEFTGSELLKAIIPPKSVAVSPPSSNLDFIRQFAALKAVYEHYPKLRKACRDREKLIKTISVLVSSAVGVGAFAVGGALLPVLSAAGLGMLVPTLSSVVLSTDEKLELIDKTYKEQYRCPNPECRDPFHNREWEALAKQKKCLRCQAVWVA